MAATVTHCSAVCTAHYSEQGRPREPSVLTWVCSNQEETGFSNVDGVGIDSGLPTTFSVLIPFVNVMFTESCNDWVMHCKCTRIGRVQMTQMDGDSQ